MTEFVESLAMLRYKILMTFDLTPEEVGIVGFKKFGTGDLVAVEENDMIKKARKQSFTEEDEEALAQENAQADSEE
jgi:hypothetical protein